MHLFSGMIAAAALVVAAQAAAPTAPPEPASAPQPASATGSVPAPVAPAQASGADPDGQAHADYLAWLARSPEARGQVLAFNQFLDEAGVGDVLPNWQLLRTASMWRECDGPRFEVAPIADWQNIATALRYIRAHVVPVVGPVQAVSGYRNGELNACARGAPASAHGHFYALDLVPVRPIGRTGLVRSLCAIHRWRGQGYDAGLGFYSGVRFHIDSKGYRRWGPDGSGATSPCVTEA